MRIRGQEVTTFRLHRWSDYPTVSAVLFAVGGTCTLERRSFQVCLEFPDENLKPETLCSNTDFRPLTSFFSHPPRSFCDSPRMSFGSSISTSAVRHFPKRYPRGHEYPRVGETPYRYYSNQDPISLRAETFRAG